jgi:hypothetical protein
MSPKPGRSEDAQAAGFILPLNFALRRYHSQARVAYLAGEFPFLMIDALAARTGSVFCVLVHRGPSIAWLIHSQLSNGQTSPTGTSLLALALCCHNRVR